MKIPTELSNRSLTDAAYKFREAITHDIPSAQQNFYEGLARLAESQNEIQARLHIIDAKLERLIKAKQE